MFLRDADMHELLRSEHPPIKGLASNAQRDSKDDPVQAASVDLTIGGIYVPGTPEGKRGSAEHAGRSLSLGPGETAVVETSETCDFPADLGAIGFPPASVSAQGLLTTNPGHIDPGYDGKLTFTVINMGKEPYLLRTGDAIVSLLLFRLGTAARAPYGTRSPGPHGRVDDERLAKLSHDFLDVGERTRAAAERSETRTRVLGLVVPIIVALIAGFGVWLQTSRANEDEINQLKQDVEVLQNKLELEKRIVKLEGAGG